MKNVAVDIELIENVSEIYLGTLKHSLEVLKNLPIEMVDINALKTDPEVKQLTTVIDESKIMQKEVALVKEIESKEKIVR